MTDVCPGLVKATVSGVQVLQAAAKFYSGFAFKNSFSVFSPQSPAGSQPPQYLWGGFMLVPHF
jgi:hypothetical protein